MNPPADHGEDSYKGTGKLQDRVAIITGGDSGIGRAVAIAFAKEGANVVLSFLPEEQADADDTASVIEKAGARVVKVAGDIRKIETIEKLISTADTQFGRLDIVVDNAGYQMSHDRYCGTFSRRIGSYVPNKCVCDVPAESGCA
jgi:NAD(P)-dependent dehydrogenase (short-subunit alcohol dehydrogenase family)